MIVVRRTIGVALCLGVVGGIGATVWAEPGDAVSPVVYPSGSSSLIFSHARHAKLPCVRCHATVTSSDSSRDRNLPAEAACRACHPQTRPNDTTRQGKAEACSRCHRGHDGKKPPARTTLVPANLRFGHRVHLAADVSCASCHAAAGSTQTKPAMARCLGCHKKKKAPTRCVACHPAEKDGRIKTRFKSGMLKPSGSLRGAAHGSLFRRSHKVAARASRAFCNSCHTPSSCLKCHKGTLRPMTIHAGDYLRRHGLDARRNETRCRSCHRSQTFCLGCHQRVGVGQEAKQSGFRPSTSRRFHDASFVARTPGPGHHGKAARRNMRSCTSCHREQSCIRCHGSRLRGKAGFSPHPPGFARSAKCRSLRTRNQRVCLKCHAAGDTRTECR